MNKGDKTSNGWATIRVDSDAESGYRGVLYEGKYDGKTEYIYATAGTDDAGDWGNNLRQLSGKSEQYSMLIGIARSLANNDKYKGISFTGHSLGGGLASANALSVEGKAVTFNAAGLSDATKKNNNLDGNIANINAFIVKGEILDWEARTTPGLNHAEGKKIVMPSAYTNWNQVNRVRNHMMKAVRISFQKFIEESKQKNNESTSISIVYCNIFSIKLVLRQKFKARNKVY